MCGEFDCTIVFLKCRYKEYEGTTMLLIIVSGDMPVTIGREMWGEPKKTGTTQVYMDGHQLYGFAERNGNEFDPLDTIPVVSVGKATYSQGESSWVVPWFDTLENPDAYVPFIYGQKFGDFRLFHKAKRFQ